MLWIINGLIYGFFTALYTLVNQKHKFNGYILGSNLLPYWFSFDLDSCHTDTAIQLQDRYNAADMDHTRLLLPVYFIETPPGSIKGKLATYDLRMIPGGEISL